MKLYRTKYRLIETYGVFFADLIAIAISYVIARYMRIYLPFGIRITEETIWFPIYVLCVLGCILWNLMRNKYSGFFERGYFIELEEVLKYNFVQFAFLSSCVYLFRLELDFSRLMLVYFVICNTFFCYLIRIFFKVFINKTYRRGRGSEKILIVTEEKLLDQITQKIRFEIDWCYEVVGVALTDIDSAQALSQKSAKGNFGAEKSDFPQNIDFQIVAGNSDLLDVARQMPIDLVFFYLENIDTLQTQKWIQSFVLMGVRCYYCLQNSFWGVAQSGVGEFAGLPVMCYNTFERDYRMSIIKRMMDLVGSLLGMMITALLFPFIAIAIKLEDPHGKIFFSQIRIGKNGRRFRIYKFRSMYADAEKRKKELLDQNEASGPIFKMEHDPRITKVGRFLRKTSLDELPQFWNIFKGDMSLVGTRPPTEEEFEQYNDYYRRRMSITPGLTGLWQVSGRSNIKDFNNIVKLDLQYIDDWSIGKDIKIILQTVGVVIFGRGSE